MKETNQFLYIHYAKIFIFLKDFIKHITYLSTYCRTHETNLGLLEIFLIVATAFIYTFWNVYKCNCINSSSKKKILLKFNENGVACF